jgi:ABC-2 type transport system ATP-binding protein
MTQIEVNHLTKDFGPVRAVDDLSFVIEPGKIVGFLGPNGSGKTTTLRSLLGLVTPTSGSATIGGAPYSALADPLREIGAMLEAAAHPARSARNHMRVVAAEARIGLERVDLLLDLVGLSEASSRKVGGFSLGMRQRLGLATALLGDPGILVLDEPANGLDPEGIRWLRRSLRGFAAEGRTVLLSSHVLAEVAETVDEVVVISDGRLIAHCPLDELTGRSVTERVRLRSPEAARFRAVLGERGLEVVEPGEATLTVSGSNREAIGQLAFEHQIVLHELAAEGPSLEETFLTMTNPIEEISR